MVFLHQIRFFNTKYDEKEASSLFTHYRLPILLILFTLQRLRQVFHL